MKPLIDHESLTLLSPYELFRLRALINHEMENSSKIADIRNSLRIGQTVEYFNSKHNNILSAIIIDKKTNKLLVKNISDHVQWWTKYYTLNLEGMQLVKAIKKTLNKASVSIGDLVGFKHNDNQISGVIIKLNPKRAKILTRDNQIWSVCYESLFAVVDVVNTSAMTLIDA